MPASRSSRPRTRRRLALACAGVYVVPVGLASRFLLEGWTGDAVGGALYAALLYLLVALVRPDGNRPTVAAVAWALCCAVELLQLTPVPRDLAAVFPPAALVLGSTFVATDLLAYAAGALLAALADRALSRSRPLDRGH
ncbi:DUF2809 domain-containing protein [Zhihengliuella sp.]|uniref:DUF2809 domain-containing protein n=1 Tax=Zhihengliuella sp. TaxID=1954483 RepID=UPI0028112BF9|nr:DUF2809 domain-containing protein [Zhihengliuella sp.]